MNTGSYNEVVRSLCISLEDKKLKIFIGRKSLREWKVEQKRASIEILRVEPNIKKNTDKYKKKTKGTNPQIRSKFKMLSFMLKKMLNTY